MTDESRVGTTCVYWEYLKGLLGIKPFVYGINGNQWDGIYRQSVKLHEEKGAGVDAMSNGVPLSSLFFSNMYNLIFYSTL
jgi:hypothetical protein